MASIKYLLSSDQLFSPVLLHNLHYNNAIAHGVWCLHTQRLHSSQEIHEV